MLFVFLLFVGALVAVLTSLTNEAVETQMERERSFYNEWFLPSDNPAWKYIPFFKAIHMSGLKLYDAGESKGGVTPITFRNEVCKLVIDVYHFEWGDQVWVSEIVIDPDHRSFGEGTKIMKAICSLADKYGIAMYLTACDAYVSNAGKVASFFRKFGFANKSVTEDGFGTFIDMKRIIANK